MDRCSRFQELIQEYEDSGGSSFQRKVIVKTPHWALFGANERGFDPKDADIRKNKSRIFLDVEIV